MVHEHIENAVDHAEMILAVGVLLLHVNEVLRHPVEAGGGHPQDGKRGTRLVVQEDQRLGDFVHLDVRPGSYCRRRDLPRTTDISPKTAPGVSTRANGTPARSTFTDPESSTKHPVVAGALFNEGTARGH